MVKSVVTRSVTSYSLLTPLPICLLLTTYLFTSNTSVSSDSSGGSHPGVSPS